MYLVVRHYRGAAQLLDALEQSHPEIERLLRAVRGFRSYYLARSGGSGISVTICEDRVSAHESNLLAADWITEHAPSAPGNAPEVMEGEVSFHLSQ